MKKIAYSPLIILTTLISCISYAGVSCDEAKITEVLVYDQKVVIKQGGKYRGLGFTSTANNQDRKLSIVLTAKATGDLVQLTYPDGYNCSEDNYAEDPELVVIK